MSAVVLLKRRQRKEREAEFAATLQYGANYARTSEEHERAQVAMDKLQVQLDLDIRAFHLDLATLHALGGQQN